jgi:hypothetical protein
VDAYVAILETLCPDTRGGTDVAGVSAENGMDRPGPSACPYLLARVSGYSSYFNGPTPAMKDGLIKRSEHRC